MNPYKNASFAGIIIIIFGIAITVYGFSFLLDKNELETNGIRVKGTVFDINENGIYRSPWIKFNTIENKEIKFLSELEVNMDLFEYEVGREVDVIYHKDNPENASIDAFWERNFGQLFLGIFGLMVMLAGYFMRKSMLKKAAAFG